MIRKNVFMRLAISMISFGILIGIIFPFFALLMGVSDRIALSPLFFISCIIAGIIVGVVNILLAQLTVSRQLKNLSTSMQSAKKHLDKIIIEGREATCSSSDCYLPVETDDDFGKSAEAFNILLNAFDETLKTEKTFRSFNSLLTSELELDKLSLKVLKEMIAYSNANAGAIYVVKNGQLELFACLDIIEADKLKKNDIILNILKTKENKFIELPEDVKIDGLLASIKPSSIIIKPIIYKNTVLGVILIASVNAITKKVFNHLEIFSSSFALALNNSLEHTQLQTLVALDPLTGIYNRKFGLSRLDEEYSSSIRTGAPIGVLMFDIDHFKNVNDTFGHIAGDRVLIDISKMARATLRNHDILMRYGGEEFVAVLPGASTHDTLVVANRLRELIQNSLIPYGENKITVTASIGVVSHPDTEATKSDTLIKYADDALYKAKGSGRNRVILYDEIVIKNSKDC